mmetsp:Transcript_74836/g.200623  ORF Transcript_74836/g.200623 Transcript_74836/m.200623 type:complete len:395 (+) Transcript_74836:2392-3576(+)
MDRALSAGAGGRQVTLTLAEADARIGATRPSTVNKYAVYIRRFWAWRELRGDHAPAAPADAEIVSAYLHHLAGSSRSAAPTKNATAALRFFSTLAGARDPTLDPRVQLQKAWINRTKGSRRAPKAPLFSFELAQGPGAGSSDHQATAHHVAMLVMQEAACRWDDIFQLSLGDLRFFAATPAFPGRVAMTLIGTKTDRESRGQEASLPWTDDPQRAAARLLALVSTSAARLASLPETLRRSLVANYRMSRPAVLAPPPPGDPVLCAAMHPVLAQLAAEGGPPLPWEQLLVFGAWSSAASLTQASDLGQALPYRPFLRAVKAVGAAAGLDPRTVGTHSLRRGGTVELETAGASHRQLMLSLRHRLPSSTEAYRLPAATACTITGLRADAAETLGGP